MVLRPPKREGTRQFVVRFWATKCADKHDDNDDFRGLSLCCKFIASISKGGRRRACFLELQAEILARQSTQLLAGSLKVIENILLTTIV